jgi:hypothetical protein
MNMNLSLLNELDKARHVLARATSSSAGPPTDFEALMSAVSGTSLARLDSEPPSDRDMLQARFDLNMYTYGVVPVTELERHDGKIFGETVNPKQVENVVALMTEALAGVPEIKRPATVDVSDTLVDQVTALMAGIVNTRLRMAVQAASRAYAESGRMVDAAVMYAAYGLPVFPLDIKKKTPVPRRDPDPTGKYPDGIPGTGGIYKATCDPVQIRKWWTTRAHHRHADGTVDRRVVPRRRHQ